MAGAWGQFVDPQWFMNQGRTVFSQLIAFLPDREFRRCVSRYDGDAGLRGFSCWEQYLTVSFALLTYPESLRDIEACLGALGAKLYHVGFQGKVARSTLADANESRDWRIFADFAHVLIRIKILERRDGQSPMMDSGHGGQEELAPVAGLRDGFHQSRVALAERVLGGRESHPQISDQRTIAVVRWRKGDLGRDCQASGAESPTGNRLHRQTGYDPRLVSEARRSEIRRLEETRIGRPPASRCGNRRAGGETGA